MFSKRKAMRPTIHAKGGEANFRRLDATDTVRAYSVVAETESRLAPLDVVVANAGIAQRIPPASMSDEK
jgi:3-oxoacyl-[acyl-carrier protein] reductase